MLYVVATPIGNLGDISARAREILAGVSVVAAEDTRHSGHCCANWASNGRSSRCMNITSAREPPSSSRACRRGRASPCQRRRHPAGERPGLPAGAAALDAGIVVAPVPGPSAAIAALSASGLPTERFCFEGFLPARPRRAGAGSRNSRRKRARSWSTRRRIASQNALRISPRPAARPSRLCRARTHQAFRVILSRQPGELAERANERRGLRAAKP